MNVDDIISRIRRGEDSVTQFKRQAIGVSCARNATIASFASKELPYRGLCTGVKRAVEVIPDIQFESDRDANWLKAIVKRENKSRNADSMESGAGRPKVEQKYHEVEQKYHEAEQKTIKVKQILSDKLREDAVRNALSVYACIAKNSAATQADIMNGTGLSRGSVNRAIANLTAYGIIEREGSDRDGLRKVKI